MPKPIPITIEVEESYAGAVIRALHRMEGIASLHLNLDADVRPPTSMRLNGQPRKIGSGVRVGKMGPRAMMYKVLATGGGNPVHHDAVAAALNPKDNVKKRATTRNVLYNSARSGFIKRIGDGYALTAKGIAQWDAIQKANAKA
jgi:hypothetical protein